MPREAEFAVLEMGMNNKGEIAALTRHGPPASGADHGDRSRAHREPRVGRSDRGRQGEIFEGLEPGGTRSFPNDTPHRDRLVEARAAMPRII
jgi:UDP-N-acetylmuramoyl-tripeptide--D-alanyl-D-alanine ligase